MTTTNEYTKFPEEEEPTRSVEDDDDNEGGGDVPMRNEALLVNGDPSRMLGILAFSSAFALR